MTPTNVGLRVRTWRSKCSVRRKARPQCTQMRAFVPRAAFWGDGDGIDDSESFGEMEGKVDILGEC
jgi:hypothetical protein